jgi:hypothetical protein
MCCHPKQRRKWSFHEFPFPSTTSVAAVLRSYTVLGSRMFSEFARLREYFISVRETSQETREALNAIDIAIQSS